MKRVVMKSTEKGNPTGYGRFRIYTKDVEYELPDELADCFLRAGVARPLDTVEGKDLSGSPENKVMDFTLENKQAPKRKRGRPKKVQP